MRERTLGPEHAEVAGSLNNLAVLLKGMGRYEEAQALYAKSIRIKEKALGPAHPQVGVCVDPRVCQSCTPGQIASDSCGRLWGSFTPVPVLGQTGLRG